LTLADRIESLRESAPEAWRYELVVIDDRSITVGKLGIALVLLVVGLFLSRRISRMLGRRVLPKIGMDRGVAAAFETIGFYVLLVVFAVVALRTINFPLTAFTILGGAVAIGVGFGSQNIVNNFISGIILLTERPIKVGDIVEVEGTQGRIERIGPRSTRVLTFDNIHMIVPNSSFLESKVVNWTLSDDIVRSHVDVGVAYGTAPREADNLIRRALKEHGRILDKPEPTVLFTEFGDSALQFRAYFWLRVRDLMDRRVIESDVRHRIDHLYREAGIVIAFPQRDVHLDAAQPLEVRIAEKPPEPPKEGA
jgi:small-conductance mechanosensitive channel